MKYNIFKPMILLDTAANLTTEFIDRERFREERLQKAEIDSSLENLNSQSSSDLLLDESYLLDQPLIAKQETFPKCSRLLVGKSLSSHESIRSGREPKHRESRKKSQSRGINLINLLPFILNLSLLTYILIKSALYSILPSHRDSAGGNMMMRDQLRKFYIYDCYGQYDRGQQYNRVQFLLILPFLFGRLDCLSKRLSMFRMNKDGYKRVNVLSLDKAYLNMFTLTTSGWWQLFVDSLRHKCEDIGILNTRRGFEVRKVNQRRKCLNSIDRIYYLNLISFQHCYRHLSMFFDDPDKANDKIYSGNQAYDNSALKCLIDEFVGKEAFLAKPAHRVDVAALKYLMVALIDSAAVFYIVNFSIFTARLIDLINIEQATSYMEVLLRSESILVLLDLAIAISVISLNMMVNTMLFASSVIHYSRSLKVMKMIRAELKFRQDGGGKMPFKSFTVMPHSNHPDMFNSSLITSQSIPEHSSFRHYQKGDSVINKNIEYLLDLCTVLLVELKDIKSEFTFYLSVTLVFSTLGSAYTLTFLMKSSTITETVILGSYLIASVFPFFFALFCGALLEYSVSIKKNLLKLSS